MNSLRHLLWIMSDTTKAVAFGDHYYLFRLCFWSILHFKEYVVILTKFSSPAASDIIKITRSNAVSNKYFIKVTFPFQCTKCLTFCWQHFHMHFLEWKCDSMHLDSNFTAICFWGFVKMTASTMSTSNETFVKMTFLLQCMKHWNFVCHNIYETNH